VKEGLSNGGRVKRDRLLRVGCKPAKFTLKEVIEIWLLLLLLLLFMFSQNLTPKKMLLRRDCVMAKEKKRDTIVMDIAPITT
jgi:hypothetical protein